MSNAIRKRAGDWLGPCSVEVSVFDWFAALFDVCSYRGAAFDLVSDRRPLEELRARHYVRAGGEVVPATLDDDLFHTPKQLAAELTSALTGIATGSGEPTRDELANLLAWVMSLDSLFMGLGATLRGDTSSPRILAARLQLAAQGSLSTSERPWGLVLPKALTGEYGQGIATVCDALTQIDADCCEVAYSAVDDAGGAFQITALRIGVIAAVQSASELEWRFFGEAQKLYEVSLGKAYEGLVIQRVLRSLEALADRAHIILLPELISSPKLVEEVSRWLETSRNRGRRLPIAVLCGSQFDHSDPSRPRNMAVILGGAGQPYLTQYKLNPYTLRADHHAGLALPGAQNGVAYRENISGSPHRVAMLDLTGLGRTIVTICEDTARWDPWHQVIVRAGPNLCLAPIMNGQGADAWDWVIRDARKISNEAGSSVFVANSGAMLQPTGRRPEDYAAASFPRLRGLPQGWNLADQGDSDGDGLMDWWLYDGPAKD